jgi:PIN domain nuclease of toxin-antitoxin system
LIANPDNRVLVSVATLWEIVVKARIGKLHAEIAEIEAAIAHDDFVRLDIRPTHLAVLGRLPTHVEHRDPFDHLLIAQAISEDALFVSEDRHASRYPVRITTCSDPAA